MSGWCLSAVLLLSCLPGLMAGERVRIAMAGDSTMSDYPPSKPGGAQLFGWGQVLNEFFDDRTTVINLAASGRSLPSFRSEKRWAKVLESKPDYVFIQFGHNDQKIKSDDGIAAKGYTANLKQYVSEAKAIGARPVLITPVARRTFENGQLVTILTDFADATKAVAKEESVPVIDLHQLSFDLCQQLGEQGCRKFAPSDSDRTHFSRIGAVAMADLVVQQLPTAVPELAIHLTRVKPGDLTESAQLPVQTEVYKSVDGRDLKLTIVNPPNWKATDQRPAIVFFHGGGWTGGAPTQFSKHSQHLASRGMVCVQVEYRLLDRRSNDPPLICVHDAKSAMRWVRSHSAKLGIDPKRIAAGGGSAGGHLAAFVGMVDGLDDPADDTSVSPKANALALFNPVFDNGPEDGWGTGRVKERFPEFSPAHNISADDPPAVVFLGTEDRLIPVSVAERFKLNMQQAGVRCELHLYEGQGHGFFNPGKGGTDEFYQATLLATDRFLTSLGWLPENEAKPTEAADPPKLNEN
ncbi:MAG: alpha/beta hydrolase fold domain-containing protein [Planctomycetaceae bacterium]